jgi:hypothetical protein
MEGAVNPEIQDVEALMA